MDFPSPGTKNVADIAGSYTPPFTDFYGVYEKYVTAITDNWMSPSRYEGFARDMLKRAKVEGIEFGYKKALREGDEDKAEKMAEEIISLWEIVNRGGKGDESEYKPFIKFLVEGVDEPQMQENPTSGIRVLYDAYMNEMENSRNVSAPDFSGIAKGIISSSGARGIESYVLSCGRGKPGEPFNSEENNAKANDIIDLWMEKVRNNTEKGEKQPFFDEIERA